MSFGGGVLAALLLAPLAAAQDQATSRSVKGQQRAAGAAVAINQIDTSAYPKVTIFATVTKDGAPLKGLAAADFRVREDEVDQEPLTVVPKLTPLTVVVALDTSGSMKKRLDDAKAAAKSFIGMLAPGDQVHVIGFAREVKMLSDRSGGAANARTAIDATAARGDTALYDALYTSVYVLNKIPGRKAIVLLSDGADDDGTGKPLSKHSVADALELARTVNVPIFTIGLGSELEKEVLNKVADDTGGLCLIAPQPAQLKALFDKIGEQLAGQYNIYYTSDLPGDGAEHRVQLSYGGATGLKSFTAPLLAAKTPQPPPPTPTPTPDERWTRDPIQKPINLIGGTQGGQLMAAPHNAWEFAIDGEDSGWGQNITVGTEAIYAFKEGRPARFNRCGVSIPGADPENLKEFEVLAGDTFPHGEFRSLGTFKTQNIRLSKTAGWQDFPVPLTTARFVKFRFLSRHGGDGKELKVCELRVMGELEPGGTPWPTPTGVNLLSPKAGGELLVSPGPHWEGTVDGNQDRFYSFPMGEEGVYGFKDGKPATFHTFGVVIHNESSHNLKEFELLAGNGELDGEFTSIGKFETENVRYHAANCWQYFSFPPVTAKYLKVKVLSTYGDREAGIPEFRLLGTPPR